MTTDTSKAPERKYSKPSDVYGADLSNVTESPEVIWLTFSEGELSWTDRRTDDEDIPYVRADIHAAMQARAERAEAALERISQYPIPRPYFGKGVEIPDAMRGIARAALERKEGT